MCLGRLNDAEKALPQLTGRAADLPETLIFPFHIAFLKSEAAGMERVVALVKGKPAAEDSISHLQALVLARTLGPVLVTGSLYLLADLHLEG